MLLVNILGTFRFFVNSVKSEYVTFTMVRAACAICVIKKALDFLVYERKNRAAARRCYRHCLEKSSENINKNAHHQILRIVAFPLEVQCETQHVSSVVLSNNCPETLKYLLFHWFCRQLQQTHNMHNHASFLQELQRCSGAIQRRVCSHLDVSRSVYGLKCLDLCRDGGSGEGRGR